MRTGSIVPAVITGLGPLSAIGCGRNAFWEALLAGRHGFGPITLCDVSDSPSKIGAEVDGFRLEDYVENGRVMARHTPRPVQMALAAGVLALHDAEIDLDACDTDRLGVHVGSSIGNMGEILELTSRLARSGKIPPHAAFHAFTGSAACVLSSFFNIRGPLHTTSQGCNSGLDALGTSLRMIQSGAVDAMLIVGTDCELVSEVMAALNASGSLSTRYNDEPGRASRPFDAGRDGNVLGEGAAGIFLESEMHANARGARIYARVVAHHVCSSGQNRQYSHDNPEFDLRPCVRAFRACMREAGWQREDVDLVNANGSSSVIYDRIEAMALAQVFGARLPEVPIHSIKSMLGQHGAGSSALQVVTSCLSIRRGEAPPTINCENLDPACGPLLISAEAERIEPARVLVHSIGLGGFYYSVAALEAVDEEMLTGQLKVRWSDEAHPRYRPAEEFDRPLKPWAARED